MKWKDECFTALDKENMFEDSGHRTRFKELMDCYSSYPFFNKGLCKCMYLSAWDEAHFCILLETLMDLSLGKEKNTEEMRNSPLTNIMFTNWQMHFWMEKNFKWIMNQRSAPKSDTSFPGRFQQPKLSIMYKK